MNKITNLAKALAILFALHFSLNTATAQGWPENYGGVMLQGFYWDSYKDSQWATLEKQANDLASTFSLIWIPQSANCGSQSMGYDDLYWFTNYNSSFGDETQLRSMIKTFKDAGLGTIADVVVNHRKNVSNWVDFPKETYKGVTYQLKSTDIVSDDDDGKTKEWASANGYSLSANGEGKDAATDKDCEGWGGMRDLDHQSENVQNNVKAYVKMLIEDFGYAGVRYDMVKGYASKYTGMYNAYANTTFSVGEYWDGYAPTVKNWINGTKVDGNIQSAAFDFPFRYVVRNALRGSNDDKNKNNWNQDANYSLLSGSSIMSDAAYSRYAVTFVENHDTEYRSAGAAQDPIRKDTLAANAFLLAMPGTPCVFLKHWQAYKSEIKAMVEARKLAGITNTSTYFNFRSNTAYYANAIKVNNENRLLVVVGDEKKLEPSTTQWTKILSGYHYAYYLSKKLETAWADKGSGDFSESFDVTLTAVSASSDAKLVYTTDGSTPTATKGTQVASGTSIKIDATTTLKVGLLVGSTVSGIITRTFTYKEPEEEKPVEIPSFCKVNEGEVCAFFEAPASWTNTIHCWAWTDSPSDNFTGGTWPGVACELLGTAANGNKVWKWTWNGKKQKNSSAKQPAFIIFNNNAQPQTDNLDFTLGGYYNIDGLQGIVTSTDNGTGNANDDEKVDTDDIVAVVGYMTGSEQTNFNRQAADVNGDGKITIADIIAIVNILISKQ